MRLIDGLRLHLDSARPDIVALVGGGGKTSTLHRLVEEIRVSGHCVIATTTTHIGVHQVRDWPARIEIAGPLPVDQIAGSLATYGHCLLVGPVEGERYRGVAPDLIDQLRVNASRLNFGAIVIEADGSRMRPIKAPDGHEPVVPDVATLVSPIVGVDAVGRMLDAATVHRPGLLRDLLELGDADQTRITPQMVARLLVHPQGGAKRIPAAARYIPILNKTEHATGLALGRIIAHLLQKQQVTSLLTATGVADVSAVRERWGPVAVVVLAAGRSARMGKAKQLVKVDGVPMVVRAVRTALAAGVGDVYVICGAYRGEVEQALLDQVMCAQTSAPNRVHMLYNEAWASGQASSLHCAIRGQDECTQAVLFMPCDQPYLRPPLLRRLVGHWRRGAQIAAPSVDGHARGAPGLFDRALWPQLLAIEGDTGGRSVLERHRQEIATVPVAGDELRDVDYPADLLA